jgi:hypothetical protein
VEFHPQFVFAVSLFEVGVGLSDVPMRSRNGSARVLEDTADFCLHPTHCLLQLGNQSTDDKQVVRKLIQGVQSSLSYFDVEKKKLDILRLTNVQLTIFCVVFEQLFISFDTRNEFSRSVINFYRWLNPSNRY